MRKIKKRWLMLSIAAFAPIVFTASCGFIKKAREDQKFDYTDSKIVKGKIIKFKKSFDFYKNFKTAGILQSVADFDNFVDNINLKDIHENEVENALNSKKRFVSLFQDKYNQKFFETKNVVFYQGQQKIENFLDSVIEKHGQIYLNYMSVDGLNSRSSDSLFEITGFTPENKIYFVEILKQDAFVHINVNNIYTLEGFKDWKNKNFYEGYGINDSKKENKNNYEYEDLE